MAVKAIEQPKKSILPSSVYNSFNPDRIPSVTKLAVKEKGYPMLMALGGNEFSAAEKFMVEGVTHKSAAVHVVAQEQTFR